MNTEELVDTYITSWNETDAARRQTLLVRLWADNARYVDPLMKSEGRDEIGAMIAAVQARFLGHRFRRLGEIDAHNDRMRFRWALGAEGADAIVTGTDFAVLADGRLQSVTGFIDTMPSA